MARPTKYKPEFCDIAIELMSIGASKMEVCGNIGISYETLFDWCNEESPRFIEEFSDTIKRGVALSQVWWEREGRISLRDRDFNSTLWFMNVKNRFRNSPEPWSDKTEVDHNIKSLEVITNVPE